jgi:hypothetical protein
MFTNPIFDSVGNGPAGRGLGGRLRRPGGGVCAGAGVAGFGQVPLASRGVVPRPWAAAARGKERHDGHGKRNAFHADLYPFDER